MTFAVCTASVTPLTAQSSRLVVATGLDNPSGLAFGPGGFLYVVEAGRGGNSTLCLPQPDADGGVFTDAGGNSLINITPTGVMSTLAVFPTRLMPNPFGPGDVPMQAVPTTVVEAPDGSLFVAELTGFPFPVGGARVYRVPANGGAPVVVAEGFTNIIDIAADSTGAGCVLEHDADGLLGPGNRGRLVRVNQDGTTTELATANLTRPGGIAIGPDGALYITNMSTSAGAGEVVRLVPQCSAGGRDHLAPAHERAQRVGDHD